jgi:[ribosomal protein S18]-alanine N-acetyltransferase
LNIRPIEDRDVDAILAIQGDSPEVAQWVRWDYARVAQSEMAGWVAEEDGVAGFLVARRIAGDLEILNLAVRPDARRRGVASSLLHRTFQWGKTFNAEKALLEVRPSNEAALQFYAKHGFQVTGRRRRYYVAPIEDALVLTAVLGSREELKR